MLKSSFYDLLEVSPGDDVFFIANDIHESGLVEYSHPNFFACLEHHTDTYYSYQFPLYNTNDYTADVDAPGAWGITMGSSSIVVAVLDDGVEACSPDIPSSSLTVLDGSNFGSSAGDDPDDPRPLLGDKHGQCCAGIIVAQHNSYGVRGIAPSCKIMPVRFDFGCSNSDVADMIDFAADNGADVLSCSWGWSVVADVITNAISDAVSNGRSGDGCVVVFSAGNYADHEGIGGTVIDDLPAEYPGRVNVNYVITVAASDSINQCANYSHWTSQLDVAAPSSHYMNPGQVFTTDRNVGGYNPDGNNVYWPNFGTDYQAYTGRFGGTSAACPLVAGIAALMLSVDSSLTAAEVFNYITSTADQVGGYSYTYDSGNKCQELGHGRVNAYAAVYAANGAKKISAIGRKENDEESIKISIAPNPANPATTITYTLPGASRVALDVYSISGQKVATLVDDYRAAGSHAAVFDGSALASGVYLYRFKADGYRTTGKILLVK